MALGLLLLVMTGYGATSIMTSNDADAQMCHCGICVYAAQGLATVLGQIAAGIIYPAIAAAAGFVIAYMALAMAAFVAQMVEKFFTVAQNFVSWFDTFFSFNLIPAMQQQTRQLNTMDVDQVRTWGGNADVQDISRVRKELYTMEAESVSEYQPGENVCTAATVTGGMTRATNFQRAYNAAAPVEALRRSGGEVGTPAAFGQAADSQARWNEYVARYCDPAENNNASGCTAAGVSPGLDIDVTGQIFQKDTIDVGDNDTRRIVDAIVTNIAEPFVNDPIFANAATGAIGQQRVLEMEAYKAKRQTIYDALYHVVARRAPGTNMQEFLQPMRTAAGVSSAEISVNPSRNEVMEVMMSERFRTGKYSVEQIDEPRNHDREIVIQQAFQVMQLSEDLDLLDKRLLMKAAEAGAEVQMAKPFETKAGSTAPIK